MGQTNTKRRLISKCNCSTFSVDKGKSCVCDTQVTKIMKSDNIKHIDRLIADYFTLKKYIGGYPIGHPVMLFKYIVCLNNSELHQQRLRQYLQNIHMTDMAQCMFNMFNEMINSNGYVTNEMIIQILHFINNSLSYNCFNCTGKIYLECLNLKDHRVNLLQLMAIVNWSSQDIINTLVKLGVDETYRDIYGYNYKDYQKNVSRKCNKDLVFDENDIIG